MRAALAHGCAPAVLTHWLWPGSRIWTTDVDRGGDRRPMQGTRHRIRHRRRSDRRRIARPAGCADWQRRGDAPARALALGAHPRGARRAALRREPVRPGLPRRGRKTLPPDGVAARMAHGVRASPRGAPRPLPRSLLTHRKQCAPTASRSGYRHTVSCFDPNAERGTRRLRNRSLDVFQG